MLQTILSSDNVRQLESRRQYFTNVFITSRCFWNIWMQVRGPLYWMNPYLIASLEVAFLSFFKKTGALYCATPSRASTLHCQLFNQCDPPTSALTLHHIASKWEALGKRQLSSISEELTFLSVLGYFGGIPQEKWIRQRQKSHTPICSASMIRVFRPPFSSEKKAPQILPTFKGCGWTRFWTENPEIHRHGIDFPI